MCEDLFHLELDLPRTPSYSLEEEIPMPYARSGLGQAVPTELKGECSHFQYSFLAMMSLRKLMTRIHSIFHECECE